MTSSELCNCCCLFRREHNGIDYAILIIRCQNQETWNKVIVSRKGSSNIWRKLEHLHKYKWVAAYSLVRVIWADVSLLGKP